MSKYDVVQLDVLADKAPTIGIQEYIFGYEARTVPIQVMLNSGRPAADELTFRFYKNRTDAENEQNEISSTNTYAFWQGLPTYAYTDTLPTGSDEDKTITVNFTMPTITTDRRYTIFVLRVDYKITGQGSRNDEVVEYCLMHVDNSVAATIEADNNYTIYEAVDASLTFTFNPGSPTASAINFSWHADATDAMNGDDPITGNTHPTASVELTRELSDIAHDLRVTEHTGNVTFTAPAVTGRTTFHGRLEIVQAGSVVDSDYFTVTIENNQVHSISVGNTAGIEGNTIDVAMTYVTGAPAADRFRHRFYATRQDARRNENELTTDIPTAVSTSPATPASGTGTKNGTIPMTLPFVDAQTVFYVRSEIIEDDRNLVKMDIWELTVHNRIRASIDMPEPLEIDDEGTMDYAGTYVTGIPAATAIGVKVFRREDDAEEDDADEELTGDDNPLEITLTPTVPETMGSNARSRTVTARVVAPDVTSNQRYYLRFYITQDDYTDD